MFSRLYNIRNIYIFGNYFITRYIRLAQLLGSGKARRLWASAKHSAANKTAAARQKCRLI